MAGCQPCTTTALWAAELPRQPPVPAEVLQGTQTWECQQGLRKWICKENCPGIVHLQAIRRAHHKEEAQPLKTTGITPIGEESPPAESSVSKHFPSILYKRMGPFYPKLDAVVAFFILNQAKLLLAFRHF